MDRILIILGGGGAVFCNIQTCLLVYTADLR